MGIRKTALALPKPENADLSELEMMIKSVEGIKVHQTETKRQRLARDMQKARKKGEKESKKVLISSVQSRV